MRAPAAPATLSDLLDAPEQAMDLPLPEAVAALARYAAVVEVLRARIAATPAQNGDLVEGLLTVDEAARRAGVSHEQFLRRRAFRPAIVRQGHKTRTVDPKVLRRILAAMVA